MDKPLLLELPICVKSYDIDVLCIVSNIVYVRWFEDLRMHLLDTYYPFQQLLDESRSPVLAQTHIDYHYGLTIHDRPKGVVWMSDLTKARWECSFEIQTDKKLYATGLQQGYFIDTEKLKPVRVPNGFLELYERENPK